MTPRAHAMAMAILAGASACLGADAGFTDGMQLYRAGRYDRATEVLRRYVGKAGNPENAGHALYVIASIQTARGRQTDATQILERLIADYPTSPWAVNACALLAQSAATSEAWDRASGQASRFLDLYLAGPYATIDDRVCRHTFHQLIEWQKEKSPGASLNAIHRALKAKHPPSSAAGWVVAFFAGADPTDPDANLVLNPGFEWDGREIGTPLGWTYRGTEPNVQDDFDGTLATENIVSKLIRARSGKYAAGKFTLWGTHLGWLYQRVPVLPGKRYEVIAYGMTPTTAGGPGRLRLGVDVKGETDPTHGGVRWSEPASPESDYEKLGFEQSEAVTAKDRFLTVFLELKQDAGADANALLFDDVAVRQAK